MLGSIRALSVEPVFKPESRYRSHAEFARVIGVQHAHEVTRGSPAYATPDPVRLRFANTRRRPSFGRSVSRPFPSCTEIVTNTGASLSATWADIDSDGFVELLICNDDQPNLLMGNLGNDNRWLKLDLKGTMSSANASGAEVRVKAAIQGEEMWQLREIGTSQGWETCPSDMRPHFGLGDAAIAELVHFESPSGIVQELSNVSFDPVVDPSIACGMVESADD